MWGGKEGNRAVVLDGNPDSLSVKMKSHVIHYSVCSPEIPLIALLKSLQIILQISFYLYQYVIFVNNGHF